jgi:hypothetical protein
MPGPAAIAVQLAHKAAEEGLTPAEARALSRAVLDLVGALGAARDHETNLRRELAELRRPRPTRGW